MTAKSAAKSATKPTMQSPGLAGDIQGLIPQLFEVMETLLAVIEKETALVRAGHLTEAMTLERTKSDLARQYTAMTTRLKAGEAHLAGTAPDQLKALRTRLDEFHALLQINLTVLATAHAVSEGIIRGVSAELTRKAAPQTYGASGRPTAPPPSASQPLTLSRVL